ncbi:MAG: hypothetical protein ACKO96_45150 [Flammeovirgaceae bacterium]
MNSKKYTIENLPKTAREQQQIKVRLALLDIINNGLTPRQAGRKHKIPFSRIYWYAERIGIQIKKEQNELEFKSKKNVKGEIKNIYDRKL